jgi:4-hydroxy-tetrahydrodipicolinate reductase
MTRVIIAGANGRMGKALQSCIPRHPELQLTHALNKNGDLKKAINAADVVIDFTAASATLAIAQVCAEARKALVLGTTGLSDEAKAEIKNIASNIPIVFAANYSTGVNALFWLCRKAEEILGASFDIEIIEMHHRMKHDAPSGTALRLAEVLAEARKQQTKDVLKHGRHGMTGQRTPQEIGMHSIRGGDVVGDHTVIFATEGERVELTHKASNRDTFAHGALRAAAWVVKQRPGLYDMQDVLGLK